MVSGFACLNNRIFLANGADMLMTERDFPLDFPRLIWMNSQEMQNLLSIVSILSECYIIRLNTRPRSNLHLMKLKSALMLAN